jgi:hypothetical protein
MNSNPTIAISLDYLVEFCDDALQADQPKPEVIILPPPPQDTLPPADGESKPERGPQL